MDAPGSSKPARDANDSQRKGPPRVSCTYENCPRLFYTELEMRAHKQADPGHAYCFKCKIDFDSRGELFIHKLRSEKHFACPICSMDFRSGGGRDCHIRLHHKPQQKIKCTGCNACFKTAATLIKHIECDECPEIRISRMLLEQHRREQVHSSLHELAMFGPMTGSFEPLSKNSALIDDVPAPSGESEGSINLIDLSSDSSHSGVKLKAPPTITKEQNQNPNQEQNHNQNQIQSQNPNQNQLQNQNQKQTNSFNPSPDPAQWPAVQYASTNTRHLTLEEVLDGAITIDKHGVIGSAGAVPPETPNDLICYDITDDPLARPQTDGHFGIPLRPITELIRDRMPGWQPQMYYNAERRQYVCNCGYGTSNVTQFEYHVAMEQRWITMTQCPQCGKVFPSTAALVSHMEQARTRCRVRDTRDFARIMADVTGGLVQIRGELPDGTDQIIARQLERTRITEGDLLVNGAESQQEQDRVRRIQPS